MLLRGADAIADKDFTIKFVKTGKYEMDQLITVYNEMIDQLRTERTQQQQQHFFLDKLIETSPTGIIILDFDENIHNINPKALNMLKVSSINELIGTAPNSNTTGPTSKTVSSIYNTVSPIRERSVAFSASSNNPFLKEITELKSGESKTVVFNGFNTYKIQKSHFIDRGFTRHFVMIEELTSEILATEKRVYGKVIRMMAHEVNNTIGPVNSIIQSTLSDASLWSDPAKNAIRNALEVAVNRNYNLTSFVRNFADIVRLPQPKKSKININTLLTDTGKLWEITATEKQIDFIYELSLQDFLIEADQVQMEQVLVNIIKNSIEAINRKGKIIFVTKFYPAQLIIKDSGKGIESLNSEQLFSPFFSTKKDGQGIGLTLVKEILINHGFLFSLEKGTDGLTQFRIEFH
ncbi:MAG: ATP-binding protein [Ginsengibacter sp.]